MSTVALAQWVSGLTYSTLLKPVVEAALRSFQNALGCIVGGSQHSTTQRAVKALRTTFGTSTCTLLGQSTIREDNTHQVDLQNAALINGIASHVHDYDDTHLSTVIHPAGAITVSLLALTEHMKSISGKITSGQAFITALVAGIEISLRVGNSVSPNHYDEGWHITGTVSSIGIAAAVSNLVGLDTGTTVNAIGLASTQVTGVRVHFGTDTKAFHVGRAAQNGILAALLAQGGLTAATDSLEGRRGWAEVVGNGANTLRSEIEGLSSIVSDGNMDHRSWEIEKNAFKPFPCGIVIHPIIDACIQLHKDHNFHNEAKVSRIAKVEIRVHHLVLDLTGKKTPRNGLEAKFSAYHGATIGLLFGSATPQEYEDTLVTQQDVRDLRAKVHAEVGHDVRSDEAYVKVTMDDGSTFDKHVEHAVGSLAKPMTDEELQAKFVDQVEPVIGKAAAELDQLAWNITEMDDMTVLVRCAQ